MSTVRYIGDEDGERRNLDNRLGPSVVFRWNGSKTVNLYRDDDCVDCFTFGWELERVPASLARSVIARHATEMLRAAA
jgi:hypothetical protein